MPPAPLLYLPMVRSKYTIFTPLRDSENYLLLNSLYGQADILLPEQAALYQSDEALTYQPYIDKGYVVSPEEEQKVYRQRYLDFLDTRDTDEIQVFFVPHYACNFRCSYCYQDEYQAASQSLTAEVIDAFFDFVTTRFAARRKYITLFGGEPLLTGQLYFDTIRRFLTGLKPRV